MKHKILGSFETFKIITSDQIEYSEKGISFPEWLEDFKEQKSEELLLEKMDSVTYFRKVQTQK